jgi:hypothetical protein
MRPSPYGGVFKALPYSADPQGMMRPFGTDSCGFSGLRGGGPKIRQNREFQGCLTGKACLPKLKFWKNLNIVVFSIS